MGEYFWAGLLAGLLIWVMTEVSLLLAKRAPFQKAGAAAFAVLRGAGHMEDMEYLLRKTRAQLGEGLLSRGRILVIDEGLDEATREVVAHFEGALLCMEKDLGPAVAAVLSR